MHELIVGLYLNSVALLFYILYDADNENKSLGCDADGGQNFGASETEQVVAQNNIHLQKTPTS